ncbi:MAG TPA: hypothetical protein VK929_11415, partial [Longimicrobiales bacterium]|nr:hypothetical protein [Longimicrobiales bacterium]
VAVALEWVLEDLRDFAAGGSPVTAIFLDSSLPRANGKADPRARPAEGIRRAAIAAAAANGIPDADATRHPAWAACRSTALNPVCRAAGGTTRIFVSMVERVGEDVVIVHAGFQMVRHSLNDTQPGWSDSRGADLRLVRSAGEWKVASVDMRIVS